VGKHKEENSSMNWHVIVQHVCLVALMGPRQRSATPIYASISELEKKNGFQISWAIQFKGVPRYGVQYTELED
jgi:hypothetical protein